MKHVIAYAATFAVLLHLASPAAAEVEGKVIYGSDDRIDLYQTKDARLLSLADSTVALLRSSSVEIVGDIAKLKTDSYSARKNLCPEEPFYSQVTAAFCSGSLVAPDIIMTAGHCFTGEASCLDTKFVFGFSIKEKGQVPNQVPASDVYGCKQLLGREQGDADWALVKLDRPVTGHAPLKLNSTRVIENKTPLVAIGHPAGLPTKIAGGASVRSAAPTGYFVANLDTYGGNSGSAVLNGVTGLVEGILVRGEQDYVARGNCTVSKVCSEDACRGEDVTKIGVVLDKMPAARHAQRAAQPAPTMLSLLDAASRADFRP
jgi:hypothetical protein